MDKNFIIGEIQRTASQNEGKPFGQERFTRETGIRKTDWYGKYWARWSDALNDAGLEANKYNEAYSTDFILEKLALFIREIGRFPVNAELRMKSRDDEDFPSHDVFNKLGKKTERIVQLLDFCSKNNQFSDVGALLPKLISQPLKDIVEPESKAKGYVYLLQHGTRYEYKIGRTNNPIRREGELTIELPEKLVPIHWIETDDPAGIEKYWHSRFSKKRLNGEWFELSADDVRAFKRWKRIF